MRRKRQQAPAISSTASQQKRRVLHRTTLLYYSFLTLLTLLLGIGVRFFDAFLYDIQQWTVAGEKIMTDADSYCWLAGAEGFGNGAGQGLGEILGFLHELSGLEVGTIAFWLPALLAPLVAIPVCMFCFYSKCPVSAVSSGLFSSSTATYFFRTRLGRYDTDLIALLFPVTIAVAIVMLALHMQQPVLQQVDSAQRRLTTVIKEKAPFLGIVLLGLWGKLYLWFYPQGEPLLVVFLIVGVLSILITSGRDRILAGILSYGFCALIAVSTVSLALILPLALISLLLTPKRWYRLGANTVRVAILVSFVVVSAALLTDAGTFLVNHTLESIHTFTEQASIGYGRLRAPSVFQCIGEFNRLALSDMYWALAHNMIFFIIGGAGFLYFIWKRPAGIVFIIFLLLGLAAEFMGQRFALYGSIPFGIGIGLGMSYLLSDRFRSPFITTLYNSLIVIAIIATTYSSAQRVPIRPRISPPSAQALCDLRTELPDKSCLWIWWDISYAAQYYARCSTFADGGWSRNTNWKIVPLSYVYAASSPEKAHRMISHMVSNGDPTDVADIASAVLYADSGGAEPHVSESIPSQYFAVSWENIDDSNWITYYGEWDFDAEKSLSAARCSAALKDVRILLEDGAVGGSISRRSIDSLDYFDGNNRRQHYEWANNSDQHVIAGRNTCIYIMNNEMYRTLMVQMLIGDPETFSPYFELVVDKAPLIRVYKVKMIVP